ncbi:DUF4249 domain-containing protein [Flavobacterium cucumis]|uniref:DUF4249 domain-containing protein n=1 Tax=Flavobacterium cucumis TaxID=416016 RepID=A0A1M7ZSX2_9FLAO|nr:DUF4249 domain-containing protein [Flavobacterium cucumis]SHO71948.1 protein of unknown function [Flavobacterium cucumis]
MKTIRKIQNILLINVVLIACNACTDPYALQSSNYQNYLVVEATLTNGLKKQEVKLTRTYRLEEREPSLEQNAIVKVLGDNGSVFLFEEENEKYVSIDEFEPLPNVAYRLEIETENGKKYISTEQILPSVSNLESIVAIRKTNDLGTDGVEIQANSFDPDNTSNFYRFTFEETYKVIVPYWSANNIRILPNNTIELYPRDGETKTCYSNEISKRIILENTSNSIEDRILNFPIHFVPQSNYKIANRYSIIVHQYIHNAISFEFYKTLKNLSDEGSSLSQVQPGLIPSNISCLQQPNEIVVGLFDIASISSERIFFNYEDIFPGTDPPGFLFECETLTFNSRDFNTLNFNNGFYAMKSYINSNQLIYYENTGATYKLVKLICGNCTYFSSNVIPPFWQ